MWSKGWRTRRQMRRGALPRTQTHWHKATFSPTHTQKYHTGSISKYLYPIVLRWWFYLYPKASSLAGKTCTYNYVDEKTSSVCLLCFHNYLLSLWHISSSSSPIGFGKEGGKSRWKVEQSVLSLKWHLGLLGLFRLSFQQVGSSSRSIFCKSTDEI